MAKAHRYSLKKSVIWRGAWYYRNGGTWRNSNNGAVKRGSKSSGPTGAFLGFEKVRQHVYSGDKGLVRAGIFKRK